METLFSKYDVSPVTWMSISSLLILGIFFKFRRLWSLRNLDLLGLILLGPGLILVLPEKPGGGPMNEFEGFVWLFSVSGFFLVRLLIDPVMVRRPLLEPNLSADGLTFTGVALLIFLTVTVVRQPANEIDIAGAQRWEQVRARQDVEHGESRLSQQGPGFPLFYMFASMRAPDSTGDEVLPEHQRAYLRHAAAAKTTAILAHLATVLGMVIIGFRHFGNFQTGVAVASLYLLLPYTALLTAHVEHAVPAALLIWMVAAYRRPFVVGLLLALAGGAVYYPLFLLPLWCSFYWQRGLVRFLIGFFAALSVLVLVLAINSTDLGAFEKQLRQMFNVTTIFMKNLDGFWLEHGPTYRFPVIAAFVALCGSFALWPVQKNLGTLLSCSAAVMVGIQFWKPHHGGLYMGWYLPLLLLTIFRPNLEDRVAFTTLTEGIWRWRRPRLTAGPS